MNKPSFPIQTVCNVCGASTNLYIRGRGPRCSAHMEYPTPPRWEIEP